MRQKLRLFRVFAVLVLFLSSVPSLQATLFTDDFESGALTNWVIGGRQISGSTNIANVVWGANGSLCGHLYHDKFTEIYMYRNFAFDSNDVFSFDLEVSTYSQNPPSSNYYGTAYLAFNFLNATGTLLGSVKYLAATTDYPFTHGVSSNNAVNSIPEDLMRHYSISVADLLDQIAIDPSEIVTTQMFMNTYSSTWPYPYVSAELWIDNVTTISPTTVPLPPSVLLIAPCIMGLPVFRKLLRKSEHVQRNTVI